MPRPTGPPDRAPSVELRDRVQRAATLRAEGHTWAAVADELGLAPATVQAYPRKHSKLWAVAQRRAWDRALAEAAAEAVTALRRLLRSDDEKVTRDAAAKLVQYATRRLRAPGTKPSTSAPPILSFLENLTHDELTTLAADALPGHDRSTLTLDAGTAAVPE